MSECFKVHYPNCAMVIDCTEIRREKPSTVQQQMALHPNHKGNYALKLLVGITLVGQFASAQRPMEEDAQMPLSQLTQVSWTWCNQEIL